MGKRQSQEILTALWGVVERMEHRTDRVLGSSKLSTEDRSVFVEVKGHLERIRDGIEEGMLALEPERARETELGC